METRIPASARHPAAKRRATLTSLPRSAWVFSSWSVAKPLEYFRMLEGLRRDVAVSSHTAAAAELLPRRPTWQDIIEAASAVHREDATRTLAIRPTYTASVDEGLAFDLHWQDNLYTISPKPDRPNVTSLSERP